MINPNWNRWIFASASKSFSDKLSGQGVIFAIEGDSVKVDTDAFEYRSSGPIWTQFTSSFWRGVLSINILVKVNKVERDFHRIYRLVGLVEAAFTQTIPVMQYGPNDNPSLSIGCLELMNKGNETIQTIHFGQVVPDLPLIQSTVGANYKIELTTD